jgi:putative (di)nucleoside polyphosphate hydrolase
VKEKIYRFNVCAVIRRDSDDSVLFCHRKNASSASGWQFPQGGIDPQKDLIEELKRELREEIGTDCISVCTITSKYYYYDFPDSIAHVKNGIAYHGQQQRWVYAILESEENISIDDSDEFDSYRWIKPHEAIALIVDFKKKVYRQALSDLGLLEPLR